MFLYKLTNRITGLSYIGATTRERINDRLALHKHRAKKGDRTSILHIAILEYGWDAFDVVILAQPTTRAELVIMERAAVVAANTFMPHGYNMTAGGDGQWQRPMTAKNKAAISRSNRGKPTWNAGITTGPMSDEARLHMSLAHRGKTPWNKGVALSESQKANIVAKNGRPIELDGVSYLSISEAARQLHLTRIQVRYRLRKGVS